MIRRTFLPLLALVATASACGFSSSSDMANYGPNPNFNAGPSANVGADSDTTGETYEKYAENDFIDTAKQAMSTFAIDVDTGSYSLMRRDITGGHLPNPDGVRPEEYLNYFGYSYADPAGEHPFAVHIDGAPSAFGNALNVMRIGVQGKRLDPAQRKVANLVFLVDVSGSMQAQNKLPLVQFALKELVKRLGSTDTLGIVTYAGADAVLLDPTPVTDKSKILDAIDSLSSGGSTNGAAGIRRAYELAEGAKRDGINRVILCTDGDFNVGVTGDALISLIEEKRDHGVSLTTLGFGMGNYNDRDMEKLADHGNGNYAYIDSQGEAVRVLGDKIVSTLQVIAKDVKIQVQFNPEIIRRYRLIGYENRHLENEDFKNDAKDAGELGAGHSVTALYEVELTEKAEGDAATVRFRYKLPEGDTATEFETKFVRSAMAGAVEGTPVDLRWSMAVAEFAEIVRKSKHSEGARFDDVLRMARGSAGESKERLEFIGLVESAKKIW